MCGIWALINLVKDKPDIAKYLADFGLLTEEDLIVLVCKHFLKLGLVFID